MVFICIKRRFIVLLFAVLPLLYIGQSVMFARGNLVKRMLVKTEKIRDDSYMYADRRNHVLEACDSMPMFQKNETVRFIKGKNLLYDSKHNFVFCMVQKIGCTYWRQVFYAITHTETSDLNSIDHYKVHDEHLPTLGHLNVSAATSVLQSATTAMFVREPYERALSGYLDKFFTMNQFYMTAVGRPIIKGIRKNATAKSIKCGHDVTFTEFIEYILRQKRKGSIGNIDHHFTPIYTHCLPCEVKYDFIGRMESFDEDASSLFMKTGIFQNRSITNAKTDSISADILNKFKDVLKARKSLSNCMTLNEMYDRVWRTLQLRGIVHPDIPMPNSQNVTLEMMHVAALKANDPLRASEYKHRAFVKMYRTVDIRLLEEFREYVLPDCKLFGYDDRPPELFL